MANSRFVLPEDLLRAKLLRSFQGRAPLLEIIVKLVVQAAETGTREHNLACMVLLVDLSEYGHEDVPEAEASVSRSEQGHLDSLAAVPAAPAAQVDGHAPQLGHEVVALRSHETNQ